MKGRFFEIVADDWRQVRNLSSHFLGCGVFRGQADSMWGLSTTVERASGGRDYKDEEEGFLYSFKREAHRYLAGASEPEDDIDWLAVLQGHGCPTRLLDCTTSFYIAVFFALEAAISDAAVWYLNTSWLAPLDKSFDSRRAEVEYDRDVVRDHLQHDVRKELKVVAVQPARLNERMIAQKGLFLFPCNSAAPFEANLCVSFGLTAESLKDVGFGQLDIGEVSREVVMEMPLLKLVLRNSMQPEALRDLSNMNISTATLFPGLEGLARSYGMHWRMNMDYIKEQDVWERKIEKATLNPRKHK